MVLQVGKICVLDSPALRGIFRLCMLHVVFFDIIVENEDIFGRHFLDHVITLKIGNSPITLI